MRLPRLRDEAIVDGKPASKLFQRWWQSVVEQIEGTFTSIENVLDALTGVDGSLTGLQAQADILDSVAGLTGNGLMEKTGDGVASLRELGVGDPTALPTRDDADARYNRIGQGLNLGIRTVTTSASVSIRDATVLADATAGAVTITLPAVADASGMVVSVKKIDASGNSVTIDGAGAETIDGAGTKVLAAQYNVSTVHCDGVAWWIV